MLRSRLDIVHHLYHAMAAEGALILVVIFLMNPWCHVEYRMKRQMISWHDREWQRYLACPKGTGLASLTLEDKRIRRTLTMKYRDTISFNLL